MIRKSCGTLRGVITHQSAGEPPCGWCRRAEQPVRIDTPGNFPSVVLVCHDGDGVYVAQDSGSSAFVVRQDPACAGAR